MKWMRKFERYASPSWVLTENGYRYINPGVRTADLDLLNMRFDYVTNEQHAPRPRPEICLWGEGMFMLPNRADDLASNAIDFEEQGAQLEDRLKNYYSPYGRLHALVREHHCKLVSPTIVERIESYPTNQFELLFSHSINGFQDLFLHGRTILPLLVALWPVMKDVEVQTGHHEWLRGIRSLVRKRHRCILDELSFALSPAAIEKLDLQAATPRNILGLRYITNRDRRMRDIIHHGRTIDACMASIINLYHWMRPVVPYDFRLLHEVHEITDAGERRVAADLIHRMANLRQINRIDVPFPFTRYGDLCAAAQVLEDAHERHRERERGSAEMHVPNRGWKQIHEMEILGLPKLRFESGGLSIRPCLTVEEILELGEELCVCLRHEMAEDYLQDVVHLTNDGFPQAYFWRVTWKEEDVYALYAGYDEKTCAYSRIIEIRGRFNEPCPRDLLAMIKSQMRRMRPGERRGEVKNSRGE